MRLREESKNKKYSPGKWFFLLNGWTEKKYVEKLNKWKQENKLSEEAAKICCCWD